MVYITGDCHADFRKFSSKCFKAQKEMTREDFAIVCGDFGGIWKDDDRERYWLNWLSRKPFTLLFVDGNHENFDRLYSGEFEVVDFHGGKAHKIADNIYHLMRGYVFELCGKSFFAFGGPSSHDIDDGILDRADFVSRREFQKTYKNWYRAGKFFSGEPRILVGTGAAQPGGNGPGPKKSGGTRQPGGFCDLPLPAPDAGAYLL